MTDSPQNDEGNEHVETAHPDGQDTTNVEDPGWPWSFILLVVAGALYLIFRFGELAINLFN